MRTRAQIRIAGVSPNQSRIFLSMKGGEILNGHINADAAYLDFFLDIIDSRLNIISECVELTKKYYAAKYNIFILNSNDLGIQ